MGALMLGPRAAAILAPKMVLGRAKGGLGQWWHNRAAVLPGFWHTLGEGSKEGFFKPEVLSEELSQASCLQCKKKIQGQVF